MRRNPLLALIAVPLIGLTAAGCQPDAEAAAPDRPAPVVEVMTVHPVSLVEARRYTGTVQPRRMVAEAFRIGGELVDRPVDVGDRVKAGTIIARLDPTDLDLAVDKAEASLAAALKNRDRAASEARRGTALLAKGHTARADQEDRALALAEAESRLSAAEKELALARNQRGYSELKASADGVVSAVPAEPGQVVAAGAPVVTVAATSAPDVLVAIPEGSVGDLDGASASVSLWAGGRSYQARLREISPTADPVTRTYAARFTIDDPDADARFGMTATVTLSKGDPAPVVRIPPTALHDEGHGPVVFALTGDTVRQTPVVVRRYESDAVIVAGGALTPGTRIVTLGVNRLENGQAVRIAAGPSDVASRN